jgi:hypothetical protein
MTIRRVGGQLLDDGRTCIACDAPAVAEAFQTTQPGKVEELRAQARAYARLAAEKAAEADALQAEVESARAHAFLCGTCKSRLPSTMRGPWSPVGAWSTGLPMGGRLTDAPGSQAEADICARTLAALNDNPYGYREPRPTPPNVHYRQRRAEEMAGIGESHE